MYPGFAKQRIQLAIKGRGKSSTVQVLWSDFGTGSADAVTGALVGGTETPLSGTMRALVHEIGSETKLRQFAEIQVGDLMLDIDPDAAVSVFDGQLVSGTVGLDNLDGPRFLVDGKFYTQADIGEELAAAWNVVFADQRLIRTLHLRRGT